MGNSPTIYTAFDFIKKYKSISQKKCDKICLMTETSFNNFTFSYDDLFFHIHCYAYSTTEYTFCINYFISKNSNFNTTLYQTNNYTDFIFFIDSLLNNLKKIEDIQTSEVIINSSDLLHKRNYNLLIFNKIPFYFEYSINHEYIRIFFNRNIILYDKNDIKNEYEQLIKLISEINPALSILFINNFKSIDHLINYSK